MQNRSDVFRVTDDLEISLYNEYGDPIPDEEYEVYLATGEKRKGKLDKDGKAIEKDVPPNKKDRVVFPNVQQANKLPG